MMEEYIVHILYRLLCWLQAMKLEVHVYLWENFVGNIGDGVSWVLVVVLCTDKLLIIQINESSCSII